MQTEIEAKWLNVVKDDLRARLRACGAQLRTTERLMVRHVYDHPDMRLEKIGGWVRVRDEGDKITMGYKQLQDRSLHGTKEVSVTIDNYAAGCDFLEAIGLKATSYQETKRESWTLDDAEIEIDTWPWIPSFVEIEASDESKLQTVASKLGLNMAEALHGSVEIAYQAVYDVTDAEIDNCPEIRFVAVPEWLEAKRRPGYTTSTN